MSESLNGCRPFFLFRSGKGGREGGNRISLRGPVDFARSDTFGFLGAFQFHNPKS
jgi:hypothetical protein